MSNFFHDTITGCNDATQQRTLGQLVTDESTGWVYRYVQFLDAVTYAAGQSVTWAIATNSMKVTNDRAGGSSVAVVPAGICLRVMTQNYFGFVLVRGVYTLLKTSGADDIAAGESLICHATTDGTCDGVAANATTTASFGFALAADVDADDTVSGAVNLL